MDKCVFRAVLILALVLAALPLSPSTRAQDAGVPYWPTDGWRTSTPEEQGMSSEELAKMFTTNLSARNIHNLLVIRHGYVVLDASAYPFRADQPHWTFSVTKSVIATLVGIAIDQGYIQSVNQPIWDFFPEENAANMDEHKTAITLEHLLTHSSGLLLSDFAMYQLTADDENWTQYVLDRPVAGEPGQFFNYLDAHAHLASAIVQAATGKSSLEFAQQNLFAPLGITDAAWRSDPQGVYLGGDGLALSPYSMAKLGYLYLRQGEWDGEQIVSSEWVKAATSHQMDQHIFWDGYGYFWWTGTFEWRDQEVPAYLALGFVGQEIWVIPDADLIVVVTGDTGFGGQVKIRYRILPSIVSDTALPANPEALTALEAGIAALTTPVAVDVPPIADETMALSEQVYTLQENTLGWQSISLDIKEDEVILSLDVAGTRVELPIGLDGIFRVSSPAVFSESTWLPTGPFWRPVPAMPLAATGTWQRDNRLGVSIWDLTGGQTWSIQLDFAEPLTITLSPEFEGSPVRIEEAE
jgi:CubicO group peptidase (beta-lactamase class C family)